MEHYANDALLQLIRKHHSPLCKEQDPMSMFTVNTDKNTTLALLAMHDRICLQLYEKQDGASLTLSMLHFDAQSAVEEIVFTYNQLNMKGYIDKKQATPQGEIVTGLTADEENAALQGVMDQLLPLMKKLCNSMAGKMLSAMEKILKKENGGISLADFGYVDFR